MNPAAVPRTLSLLLSPNDRYAQHAAACLASLLDHSEANFDVVVATTEDPGGFADRLRRSFAGNGRISLDIKQFQLPAGLDLKVTDALSAETYLRLGAHELMPGRKRVVYLDCDVIAAGPIDELWQIDLGGKAIGAVPIPNSVRVRQHGMPPGSQYFNSGVILMDLEAWRSRDYCSRSFDWLRENMENAYDVDQDALNLVAIGDWLPLPYKWNVINPFFRPSIALDLGMTEGQRLGIVADARFIHFNGPHKPWVYLDNHPRQRDYMFYLEQTDWRGWRPADRTPANMVRKRLSRALPPWFKDAGRAVLRRLGWPKPDGL